MQATDGVQQRVSADRGASRREAIALLALSSGLLLFANGRIAVAIAAWLAPVLLLRFTRTVRPRLALPACSFVLFLAWMFQFRGMVPAPAAVRIGVAAAYRVLGLCPYAIDTALVARIRGTAATLVFPCRGGR